MATSGYNAPRILRSRIPRVCVAVIGATPEEMIAKAEGIIRENPFLEFRLDYLTNPAAALPKVKRLLETRPDAVIIGTCRRAVNGGKFKGSASAQLEILAKAAAAGCQLLDVELETAESVKASELQKLREAASIILSFHDFKATKKLDDILARMVKIHVEYYKVVSTATSLYDNVQMMKFLEKHGHDYWLIGLCMGEQGIISRVLSVRAGSVFTFAAASAGEETAPGQVTYRDLRSTFRIDHVDAATHVYGVAGDPVAHSLSPAMMNLAFRRENVNGVYLALHTKKTDDLMACIRDIPLRGLSITMPHKEEMVKHLANTDDLVRKIGAVNTIVRAQDGKLYGFNTDVAGIVGPLSDRITVTGAKILVVGAGGAARAAVFGLAARGAHISIVNRTVPKAQKLAKEAGAKVVKRADLKKLDFDVIINATSVGMMNPKVSPLEADELRARIVFDMVYNPVNTRLIQLAKAKGLATIPGYEMFVQQGARQFEIWSGKPAPVEEMRGIVMKALGESPVLEAPTPVPPPLPAEAPKPAVAAKPVAGKTAPVTKSVLAAKPAAAKSALVAKPAPVTKHVPVAANHNGTGKKAAPVAKKPEPKPVAKKAAPPAKKKVVAKKK
ncbi:3-dehydroquinate dehydratase / shikimate dehydrogenase [Candidatus Koribacter versatilis Ellin345]|uniref:Multifunctional fusion protein n=1 Tax=Koribacter versatilis (strain Ellin345) TaxID=204669 RepID=Q1IJ40_KORVE|nr:shikimate dehydrogenase [Candidatus Koribacter versatilis]ABF43110.1 3-dehydroquinate dehydratase / shikimate dehydrogenase [Candidatus Koribacter versatilis Ellin345]